MIRWLVFILLSAFVRVAVAAPPSGYSCGEGGKPIKDQGCQCPAGKAPARDGENIAVCVAAKPRAEPDQPTAANACMKDRKGRYIVKVDSTPSGATVYIGDKACGTVGTTPWSGLLNAGPAIVIVEKDGHGPMTRNIDGKTAKTLKLLLPKANAAVAHYRQGKAFFDAKQYTQATAEFEAAYAVDKLPSHLFNIARSLHLAGELAKAISTYQRYLDVEPNNPRAGEVRKLIAEATQQQADSEAKRKVSTNIGISSQTDKNVDGAQVSIDGLVIGSAPLVKIVTPGRHLIELEKPGFEKYSQWIEAKVNERTTISPTLKSTAGAAATAVVRVLSSTANARAWIDGIDMGPAPVDIKDVKSGDHILQVKAPGFRTKEAKVVVVGGQNQIVKLDLEAESNIVSNGTLKVVSMVPESEVFIDGALIGKAPVEKVVAAGEHFVVVRRAGYLSFEQKVRISAGQTVTMSADLKKVGRP